jgi:3-methyladenine DNA glycosylase AlkC
MTENFQVRDVFNPRVVAQLAESLKGVWQPFDRDGFCKMIVPKLPELTLSERSQLITDALAHYLPDDFPAAAGILLKALPTKIEKEEVEGYDSFIIMPQSIYISKFGMAHFDLSMQALYEMTQRFTAEFAIRFFIEKYPEKTLALLADWATDPSPHVRRLVSEGTRPLLPWALRLKQFVKDPAPTLTLLELLKNDPVLFVRRSVANHLNDHAKNHPDLVVETLNRWKSEHPGNELDWLVKHATRTLVKKGHPGALELIGFKKGADVKMEKLAATPVVNMGDYLALSFDLIATGNKAQDLVIDYVIYFKKADGSLAPKVFKFTTKTIAPGEKVSFQKRHSFRKITTRVYYPGEHEVTVQVNGEEVGKAAFVLKQAMLRS